MKRDRGRDRVFIFIILYLGLFTFGEPHSVATGRTEANKEKFKIEREGGRWVEMGRGRKTVLDTLYSQHTIRLQRPNSDWL